MSEVTSETGKCEVCGNSAERKCSACKLVFYCNAEHQKENWNEHKSICKPYEICFSDELGKYMKATRNLQLGDVVFVETPILFGPKPHKIEQGPFPCVGCCRLLYDQTCDRCPCCFWPICNIDCKGLKVPSLHGFECNILRLRQLSNESMSFYEYYRFDILIILRALYLQKSQSQKWESLLNLESHQKERGPKTEIYKIIEEKVTVLQDNYLTPLKAYEKESNQAILPEVSSEIIHKIYGVLDVNFTELTTEEIDACIIYPIGSILEHNCTPNTMQIIDENDKFKITFRAALSILKGENITSIYTHILWGTSARRDHLKKTKYFSCTCKRCGDPTEFGTLLSALKCLGTEKEPCGGIQLPENPTEDKCVWVCDKCNIKLPNKNVMKFVNHLNSEVDKVMDKNPKIAELEDLVTKLLHFFHPNHYLVYSVKHSLVQLYGNEGDVEISNDLLKEKLEMCKELISITKKIDPGNARLALYLGVLLNEEFVGKFKLLSRNYQVENKENFTNDAKEIKQILEDNMNVLKYEQNSQAGLKLYKVVCENDLKFLSWIKENSLEI